MKIAFFDTKPDEKEYFEKILPWKVSGAELFFYEYPLSASVKLDRTDFDAVSVFSSSVVNNVTIDSFQNLKFASTRSTGYDHIDVDACRERGVVISYVPSYGEYTVAEFAFALLLALSRKIVLAAERVKSGQFSYEGLRGFDLHGKTLGVIGTGHIGRYVIRMAKGFSMNVLAFDLYPNEKLAREFEFSYATFPEVLSQSDAITLHVPYMKETHHLLNQEAFMKMKKGALLINTSRGTVVDTRALAEALRSGHLGGAGLDVLEEENALKNPEGTRAENEVKQITELNRALFEMENVVVTPHTAFNTVEAVQRIMDTTIENIVGFFAGKPINIVK